MRLDYHDRTMTDADRLASLEVVLALVITKTRPVSFTPLEYAEAVLKGVKPNVSIADNGNILVEVKA
jgi:hypothetical protein